MTKQAIRSRGPAIGAALGGLWGIAYIVRMIDANALGDAVLLPLAIVTLLWFSAYVVTLLMLRYSGSSDEPIRHE